jgi:hypothetical protein
VNSGATPGFNWLFVAWLQNSTNVI